MLILMGPSASGKTEIAKLLQSKYHLQKVVTHTTREIRINEVNDIDYHFVTKNDFLALKEKNEFVETTIYNNNFYGTSKKEIADNKCVVLDPEGAKSFKELNDKRVYVIYLSCPEDIRVQRMKERNDDYDKIISRINNDRISFNDSAFHLADIMIKSNLGTIQEITEMVYNLYINHLTNIK